MPLTKKGLKLKRKMMKEYGGKKGEEVFSKMENRRKIKGMMMNDKEMTMKALNKKIIKK